jgi:hypothetical protein
MAGGDGNGNVRVHRFAGADFQDAFADYGKPIPATLPRDLPLVRRVYTLDLFRVDSFRNLGEKIFDRISHGSLFTFRNLRMFRAI